jgi:hypothetical protein
MKMKKLRILKIAAWLSASIVTAFLYSGCTGNFADYNKDVTGLKFKDLAPDFKILGGPIQEMQLNIYVYQPAWVTQLQQNLIADIYSGYMMTPTPFIGDVNNTTYALVDGWNSTPWSYAYLSVMSPSVTVLQNAKLLGANDYYAWAKILRVEAMHRLSDIYGPIVYSKFGVLNKDGSVDYDSQQQAYNLFFADLDSAINVLTPLAQSNAPQTFTAFDLVYGGSFKQWTRFANTLRLRLAMRISSVDPVTAKKQGEAALANPMGLLQDVGDIFNVNIAPYTHPLNVINNSWGDIRLGAPVESIMTGYNDPRLPNYALPSSSYPGQYKGIRNGIANTDKSVHEGFSQMVTFPGFVTLMTPAEAYFLRAEAALKGWAGAGAAQANYESGISASFAQWGVSAAAAATYIADNTSTPAPYVDPTNSANNVNAGDPHLSTATIAWANDGHELERIITQKWIAMYPEGQEAWSEFRRTLFPKLFPVVVNNSQGLISTQYFIRRVNFPNTEYSNNAAGVAKAVNLLGGLDNGGTPLWWDTNPH